MIIVIFGAAVLPGGQPSPTLRARVEAAFRCGGLAARYVPTGAVGKHGPSEARVMARLLMSFGVPRGQIVLEETGVNTRSSARACAALLAGQTGPVWIATSGYHLPRCLMLMRMAGVVATACPPPPAQDRRWYWRLRECVALPVDAVRGWV
jgi:uncharacterized SAM-binding protein YcdF (DUF218 family)